MEKYSRYRWFSILPLSPPTPCLLKDSEAAACWGLNDNFKEGMASKKKKLKNTFVNLKLKYLFGTHFFQEYVIISPRWVGGKLSNT